MIERIREKHDPLYKYIWPHITLVFPFESELPRDEIEEHIRSNLEVIKPFEIGMKEITGTVDNYLFLNVKKGNDEIIRIHDLLYSDILDPYRDLRFTFIPHITVGRFEARQALIKALVEYQSFDYSFKTIINEVVVEIIDAQENSIIETRIPLI